MTNIRHKYRLLTRSDFDGLVCAMLLKDLEILGDIKFVHPKDVQDGKIEVNENDILTNLPYVETCHLCFDHHDSEAIRNNGKNPQNLVLDPDADSAARVVYRYFGGEAQFADFDPDLLEAVDRADSARFTRDEILHPTGWNLMSFLMDARTGLGRFREFRVSNYQLMMDLIDHCKGMTIEQVLQLPDVRERVDLYREHHDNFVDQLRRCSTVHGNVVVVDLRGEETIFAGNRFVVYSLFPECNVSIHVIWGLKQQNTVLAIGKSILNRTSQANIGSLALEYAGGGHEAAGTCQIANDEADRVLSQLVARLQDSASEEDEVFAAAGDSLNG
jgi:nanoRNase/pAp phosphatase (c-di-AMP/oligoRNAs hydrolase)